MTVSYLKFLWSTIYSDDVLLNILLLTTGTDGGGGGGGGCTFFLSIDPVKDHFRNLVAWKLRFVRGN